MESHHFSNLNYLHHNGFHYMDRSPSSGKRGRSGDASGFSSPFAGENVEYGTDSKKPRMAQPVLPSELKSRDSTVHGYSDLTPRSREGIKPLPYNAVGVKVKNLSTNRTTVYQSVRRAGESLGINPGTVSRALNFKVGQGGCTNITMGYEFTHPTLEEYEEHWGSKGVAEVRTNQGIASSRPRRNSKTGMSTPFGFAQPTQAMLVNARPSVLAQQQAAAVRLQREVAVATMAVAAAQQTAVLKRLQSIHSAAASAAMSTPHVSRSGSTASSVHLLAPPQDDKSTATPTIVTPSTVACSPHAAPIRSESTAAPSSGRQSLEQMSSVPSDSDDHLRLGDLTNGCDSSSSGGLKVTASPGSVPASTRCPPSGNPSALPTPYAHPVQEGGASQLSSGAVPGIALPPLNPPAVSQGVSGMIMPVVAASHQAYGAAVSANLAQPSSLVSSQGFQSQSASSKPSSTNSAPMLSPAASSSGHAAMTAAAHHAANASNMMHMANQYRYMTPEMQQATMMMHLKQQQQQVAYAAQIAAAQQQRYHPQIAANYARSYAAAYQQQQQQVQAQQQQTSVAVTPAAATPPTLQQQASATSVISGMMPPAAVGHQNSSTSMHSLQQHALIQQQQQQALAYQQYQYQQQYQQLQVASMNMQQQSAMEAGVMLEHAPIMQQVVMDTAGHSLQLDLLSEDPEDKPLDCVDFLALNQSIPSDSRARVPFGMHLASRMHDWTPRNGNESPSRSLLVQEPGFPSPWDGGLSLSMPGSLWTKSLEHPLPTSRKQTAPGNEAGGYREPLMPLGGLSTPAHVGEDNCLLHSEGGLLGEDLIGQSFIWG